MLKSGEFESVVLQAFKYIETGIKDKVNAKTENVEIKLIRQTFHPGNGKLTDYDLSKAERKAFSNYITGSFGYYKNPCLHLDVKLDFNLTFDRIIVTSDLLK